MSLKTTKRVEIDLVFYGTAGQASILEDVTKTWKFFIKPQKSTDSFVCFLFSHRAVFTIIEDPGH